MFPFHSAKCRITGHKTEWEIMSDVFLQRVGFQNDKKQEIKYRFKLFLGNIPINCHQKQLLVTKKPPMAATQEAKHLGVIGFLIMKSCM